MSSLSQSTQNPMSRSTLCACSKCSLRLLLSPPKATAPALKFKSAERVKEPVQDQTSPKWWLWVLTQADTPELSQPPRLHGLRAILDLNTRGRCGPGEGCFRSSERGPDYCGWRAVRGEGGETVSLNHSPWRRGEAQLKWDGNIRGGWMSFFFFFK